MDAVDYRTISAVVRPPRVAALINRDDPDWRETCLRIIELFSQMWGGKYNVIVPTDGRTISDTFWQLLDAFDPDYLARYRKTLRDLKVAKPHEYSAMVDAEVARLAAEGSEVQRDQIDAALLEAGADLFNIDEGLQHDIKQLLAPFHFQGNATRLVITARGSLPQEIASVATLLSNVAPRPPIRIVRAKSGVSPLRVASIFGLLNEGTINQLKASNPSRP